MSVPSLDTGHPAAGARRAWLMLPSSQQRNAPCICCLSINRIKPSGWLGVLCGLDMSLCGDQSEAVGLSAVQSGIRVIIKMKI